ncbi:methyltransferase domain-containing protein [Streptomyces sp. NPDC092296]|uniref:methyltransferase domain-containing protein n=1 Tax=Streptomyces sp. NPDC092296 TaxID=3366012 RepID=UPI00380AA314
MTTETASAERLRRRLANQLAAEGALGPAWYSAFAAVPREIFVPEFTVRTPEGKQSYGQSDPAWLDAVYTDTSLLTQFDATGIATSSSTAPSVMARMLEALSVRDGSSILEVGTGTGYNAALLTHRLGGDHVVSIDVDPGLVGVAGSRLRQAGYAPTLVVGDGMRGCPQYGPYDRLLATCGVGRVPGPWRYQVRPGGVIVATVGCGVARLVVGDDRSASGGFLPHLAWFMTSRPTPGALRTPAGQFAAALTSVPGRTRTIRPPAGLAADGPLFLACLAQPDVEEVTLAGPHDRPVRYLVHQPTASWARFTSRPDGTVQLDHEGPRDLWAEREPLLAAWVEYGRPGPSRFGLNIDPDGAHTLWLDAPTGPKWTLTD